MPTGNSDVTVIIAAYNSAPTIGRAVRSALGEPEVSSCIVIDDGSRDATIAEARGADDGTGRLNVVVLAANRGPSAARNAALAQCRSGVVCVLDADDFFLRGRLARLVPLLSEYDFVADDILIIPEGQEGLAAHFFETMKMPSFEARAFTIDSSGFILSNISRRGRARAELGFLKPLMRRSFLFEQGLRYDEDLRLGEDYALYVRALLAGARFRVVEPCGYIAVERRTSLSSHHSAADLISLAEFDRRCLELPDVEPSTRAALKKHLRATSNNANFRLALDARQARGLAAGAACALSTPQSLPHMLSAALRARAEVARATRTGDACAPVPRFLLAGQGG